MAKSKYNRVRMDIEDCIDQFKEVFDGQPWYGNSILKSLEGIDVQFWDKRKDKKGHTITELLYHLIDWRVFVIEKLGDNETYSIELNSEKDWRKSVSVQNEENKRFIINLLKETQQKIIQLLDKKPDSWLYEFVLGKDYKNSYMIHGVIQHDIYHLGQINALHTQLKTN